MGVVIRWCWRGRVMAWVIRVRGTRVYGSVVLPRLMSRFWTILIVRYGSMK